MKKYGYNKKEVVMDRYMEWYQLSLELKQLKEKEMKLRKELCEDMFDGKVGRFVVTKDTPDYKVKATSKVTTQLDEDVLKDMYDDLSEIERAAVKFKPSLVAKQYNKLSVESMLHEAVIQKPATPTLKIDFKKV
jgi:hypothetical protein